MHNFLPVAYFENKFVPFKDANLSIATHALHYGTGAFGGMRGIPNPNNSQQILLFRLDRHAQRLSNSAKFLNYDLPVDKIQQIIIDFVKKNQPDTSFYIRPFVYTSDLGIAPRLHKIEKNFFVYGLELGDYLPPDGISCRISSWYRQEDRSLPLRGKISGAYITSSLAKTEAVESGLDQDILEGITRDSVIAIAKNLGIEVIERSVDKTELFIADEVFLSGTAAKITPVKQVETYKLSSNRPITDKLKAKLTAITTDLEPDYQDWVYKIDV